MASIERVRILVVGDSGVGKTCLTHLISHNESLTHPGWTVGCSVEVKLHEYKEGTPQQKQCFIELYDIGGSLIHKNSRGVFYSPTNGIILVHDLTNRKSQENLSGWLMEILNKDGKDTIKSTSFDSVDFDTEQFFGSTQIPILVIGTKLDLLDEKRRKRNSQNSTGIAEQCGAEEIWLSCRNSRSLAPGTTDAVKLVRFFDRVIEKKQIIREGFNTSDRRRIVSPYTSPEQSPLIYNE